MEPPVNILIVLLAALVPNIVGTIWYNQKVMGTAWQKLAGVTNEEIKQTNMGKMILVGLIYSLLISYTLGNFGMIVHQGGIASLAMTGAVDDAGMLALKAAMEATKDVHRSFGHGAFHGVLVALFFALPIIGTHALYEKKKFKLVLIHVGYWAISFALMGGILCQWG